MTKSPIACIGLSTDDTYAYTVRKLQELSNRPLHIIDMAKARAGFSCSYSSTSEQCFLRLSDDDIILDRSSSCYQRYISVSRDTLPTQPASKSMMCAEKLIESLLDTDFFDFTVNPLGAGWCNGVRGTHYQFLRTCKFSVPEYVVTNDPDIARNFVSRHRDVVVKSPGHHRTVVRKIGQRRLMEFDRIKVSPVVLQVNVRGPDVRVHVVGDRCFAVQIESPETDYRYVARRDLTFSRIDAPRIIADRCIEATSTLGLKMAGIDFKIDFSGEWHCLEVNPMPGYSGYDAVLDGTISSALVELLQR